ncbi:MAG: hypothetical protein FJZ58_00465 [Chlamydiae bacterium]|nr:hypothetical protein [Chlamydiota bacterium]
MQRYDPLTLMYRDAQKFTRNIYNTYNTLSRPALQATTSLLSNTASTVWEQYSSAATSLAIYRDNYTKGKEYQNITSSFKDQFLEAKELQESSWTAVMEASPSPELLGELHEMRKVLGIKVGQCIYAGCEANDVMPQEKLSLALRGIVSIVFPNQEGKFLAGRLEEQLPLHCLSAGGKYFVGSYILDSLEGVWFADLSFSQQVTYTTLEQALVQELTIALHDVTSASSSLHYITKEENKTTYSCPKHDFHIICQKKQKLYQLISSWVEAQKASSTIDNSSG